VAKIPAEVALICGHNPSRIDLQNAFLIVWQAGFTVAGQFRDDRYLPPDDAYLQAWLDWALDQTGMIVEPAAPAKILSNPYE